MTDKQAKLTVKTVSASIVGIFRNNTNNIFFVSLQTELINNLISPLTRWNISKRDGFLDSFLHRNYIRHKIVMAFSWIDYGFCPKKHIINAYDPHKSHNYPRNCSSRAKNPFGNQKFIPKSIQLCIYFFFNNCCRGL